jgi:GT2 family glycosyltransferase
MTDKKLTVSVVMPNLNGEKLLEKNLPKLIAAENYIPNNIIELIVVDDGSWDDSVNFLRKNFPQVRLFKHKTNRGFSAAVDTGARASKGDLILLINNDVIPERDFLVKALADFKDKLVFAVSLHEKGFGSAKGTFAEGYIKLAMGEEGNKLHPSFYVSGGSGVFRRDIWMELGGMDEKLLSPFYWEDIDLCYRASKRGYKLLWEPGGVVEHHHESTIGKFPKDYVARVRERNQLLMLWKDVTSPNLTRKHIAGLIARLVKHPGYIRIVIMAFGRFGTAMQKRKKEIKECKVSDEAIFSRYA